MRYTPNQSAYSLVFAFMVMTVILIVASTTIENTVSKVRYFSELEGTTQARLAAESAAERAISVIRNLEAGYVSSEEQSFCSGGSGTSDCQSYGNYQIFATGTELTDSTDTPHYYLPIAGTGTAGLSEECSVLNVTGDYEKPDHVCNWNKLMYGESVTIPLYGSNEDGTGVRTASELGVTSWSLRVRTPCSNGSQEPDCDGGVRMEFYTGDDSLGEGDSVILWQVIYDDGSGNLAALVPNDMVVSGFTDERGGDNTEIYEKLINDASIPGDFLALNSDSISGYAGVVDALEAVLQLDIVSRLATADETIPYLEWQLELSGTSSSPFADSKSVVVGEGYYEVDGKTYYFPYVVSRSTIGEGSTIYTLSN